MTLLKRISALFLVLMATVAASAIDYTLNVGVTPLKSYETVDATFTCNSDANVLIEALEVFEVYLGENKIEHIYAPGAGEYAYKYEVNGAKAGDVIRVHSDFVWNSSSKLKVTVYGSNESVPVEVKNISPAAEKEFKWTTTGMVSINFNKEIYLKNIKFIAGSYETGVDDVHMGSSLGFNITNALNGALESGALNPGDQFVIRITGLCDYNDEKNLYNGDGVLEIKYVAPSPQGHFVQATVNENKLSYMQVNSYEFLSYYSKEEADGVFVFEFDKDVKSIGGVLFTMGNIDLEAEGKYHRSNLPYKIEGNKVVVDVRGTLRSLAVLFPAIVEDEEEGEGGIERGTFDTEHLTITISNVIDNNGNAFLSDLPGSVGSYSFVMRYKEIVDDVTMDGDNKAEGDAVMPGDEVSLWVSNATVKFDGIDITYFVETEAATEDAEAINEPRVVHVSEYTSVPDPFEGIIVTFTMPEMPNIIDKSVVRVAFRDASTADGMPHSLVINFVYGKGSGEADCVKTVGVKKMDGAVYNLQGVKVSKNDARKGMFIENGKKVIK